MVGPVASAAPTAAGTMAGASVSGAGATTTSNVAGAAWLPAASRALHVTVVTACANGVPDAGVHVTGTGPSTRSTAAGGEYHTSSGRSPRASMPDTAPITGGVTSRTVMACVAAASPLPSDTVKLTRYTPASDSRGVHVYTPVAASIDPAPDIEYTSAFLGTSGSAAFADTSMEISAPCGASRPSNGLMVGAEFDSATSTSMSVGGDEAPRASIASMVMRYTSPCPPWASDGIHDSLPSAVTVGAGPALWLALCDTRENSASWLSDFM